MMERNKKPCTEEKLKIIIAITTVAKSYQTSAEIVNEALNSYTCAIDLLGQPWFICFSSAS